MNRNMITIEQIRDEFLKEKQGIYEAISRDYRENEIKLDFNKLLEIFNKINEEDFSNNNESKILTIIYNGNPYVTLELAIKGILYNANLILISDSIMENSNKAIINTIKKVIDDRNIKLLLKWYPDGDVDKISKLEDITNKIIFLGDKRNHRKLKNRVDLPIVYNGFGSIIIYTDDQDEFEEQIYKVKNYAIENNISVNLYYGEIKEDIESINKDGINHICIIFSNDNYTIEQFKKFVKSSNIIVNSTKIEDISLELPKNIWF